MDQQREPVAQNAAGQVWAAIGVAILAGTFLSVGWIQWASPLPLEAAGSLFALGVVPASIAVGVGCRRSYLAKAGQSSPSSRAIPAPGVRIATIGFVLLVLGVIVFVSDCVRRESKKSQWVAEAEVAVESALRVEGRIPPSMKERLGVFEELTGQGHAGPTQNIGGFFYLIVDRDARFSKGTIPIRIYVTEGRVTNRGSTEIQVLSLEVRPLYLLEAPLPKSPMEGLQIMVLHPALGRI